MRKILALTVSIILWASVAAASLHAVSFQQLPHWSGARAWPALQVFRRSCLALSKSQHGEKLTSLLVQNQHAAWANACRLAKSVKPRGAKHFFEQHFQPYLIKEAGQPEGLLTGYYLPSIKASLRKTAYYEVPIYARPKNLVTTRLEWFSEKWKNEKIAGYVKNGRLYPYTLTRKQINAGALGQQARVIAYVHSRVDRFFLQVQGSGYLDLPHGKRIAVGYDGENGQPYYPIGRWFLEKGLISKKEMSMQAIMAWLNAHPRQANAVLNLNPSFVFFQRLPHNTIYGTDAIPLTADYSLCVDTRYIPLGLPVFVSG